jgi:hypothetical protein
VNSLKTIACELPVQLAVSHDVSVPLSMSLRYDPCDPYAVRASFHPVGEAGGRAVDWFFSRDVMTQALTAHAGQGDVRMWPSGSAKQPVLSLALSSPTGSALITVCARHVRAFLEETRVIVPPGAESEHCDLDAELTLLLSGS